ncbi:hypothetical protein [Sphingopyxis sp. NJF-3]
MERKQIFGMDVIEDPNMPPGTFKLVNPAPHDDVYVSDRGMTFVRKMTRAEFDEIVRKRFINPAAPHSTP